MAPGDGVRRNVADIAEEERVRLQQAIIKLNKKFYPGGRDDTPTGGVSYWFKQDEIHAHTHVHGSPAFLPWHRELVNRFEALIREVDPTLSLHYWDWTQDPQKVPDGQGGTFNLFTDKFMGSPDGEAGEPWVSNGFYDPNASNKRSEWENDPNNNPFDPPGHLVRHVAAGAPITTSRDNTSLGKASYPEFWNDITGSHDNSHGHIGGAGGTLSDAHKSFRDPFVFLLHSNVDRLFALWQLRQNVDQRLDPMQVYGSEGNSVGSGNILNFADWGILSPVEPWAGPAAQNASTGVITNVRATRPWAPPENLQNAPENSKNHKHWTIVKPPCYDTNPTIVEVLNAGNAISFNQIPTGETTIRAASFRFFSCFELTFTVKSGPNQPFNVFSTGGKVTATQNHDDIWSDARMWFSFTGGASNTSVPSSPVVIHVESSNFSQDFTFTLTANSIARPTVAVVLALDQSGSMNDPAGTTGLRRIDALKYAAKNFVEVIQPGNGMGLINFDDPAYAINDAKYPGLAVTAIGEGVLETGRSNARNAVNAHNTNPNGFTSIGAGVVEARKVLNDASGWANKAIIVFTDGLENRTPWIASVLGDIDARTFAVGLGNPQQISTSALNALTNASGGYTYITGTLGPTDEDFFKLTKYFLQILAGVTNTDIVHDPTGFLPRGVEVKVPFSVADIDIESTVVLLSDLPAINFTLLTPSGKVVTPAKATSSGMHYYDAGLTNIYRFTLPATLDSTQEATGTWYAVLKINEKRFTRYCPDPEDPGEPRIRSAAPEEEPLQTFTSREGLTPCRRGGVRYNVSMYAWSNLHMKANVYQDSQQPGATLTIRALLEEYGVPFGGGATIKVEINRPDNTKLTLPLPPIPSEKGTFETSMKASLPGVYQIRIIASGSTTKGFPFTREAILTACAVIGGDSPLPGSGGGGIGGDNGSGSGSGGAKACCLLNSLLKNQGVRTFLKKSDLDAGELVKCVEECCHRRERNGDGEGKDDGEDDGKDDGKD